MSKYPAKYLSKSKGVEYALEEMHSSHLANAYKSLARALDGLDLEKPEDRERLALVGCMADELRSRGATVEDGAVTWPSEAEAGPQPEVA